jgi:cell division protein FtsB
MQNNIFQLRSELATIKSAKNELEDEVNILKQAQGFSFPPKNPINSNLRSNNPTFINLRHFQNEKDERRVNQANVDLMKSRCPEDLALRISNLEDKLCQERSDYENKIEKLQAENDFLRQKVGHSLLSYFSKLSHSQEQFAYQIEIGITSQKC